MPVFEIYIQISTLWKMYTSISCKYRRSVIGKVGEHQYKEKKKIEKNGKNGKQKG